MPVPDTLAPSAFDLLLPTQFRSAPYFHEYFGIWSILEAPFQSMADRAKSLDLHVHMTSDDAKEAELQSRAGGDEYPTRGSTAIIPIQGTLMKQVSSFSGGTSTVQARRQIRAAADNDAIGGILLHIESPGGTVAGTKELADDIAAAAKRKPVIAYIEDIGASAAYWLASQAKQVFCNPTALVGSIGTFMVVHDMSGAYSDAGIKVHVVRAGDFKGSGTPGTEITADQLAEYQRITNDLNEHFIQGVADGRKLSKTRVRELADGRIHSAGEAQKLGLVDGVESFDATLARLQGRSRSRGAAADAEGGIHAAGDVDASEGGEDIDAEGSSDRANGVSDEKDPEMADNKPAAPVAKDEPRAATMKELKKGCPGASSDFLVEQIEQEATLADAQVAWMQRQADELADLKAKAAEKEEAKAGKSKSKAKGKAEDEEEDDDGDDDEDMKGGKARSGQSKPLGGKPSKHTAAAEDHSDAVSAWEEAVAKEKERNPKLSNAAAVLKADQKNPGLRDAYVEAKNAGRVPAK